MTMTARVTGGGGKRRTESFFFFFKAPPSPQHIDTTKGERGGGEGEGRSIGKVVESGEESLMMEGWERSICFDATIHLNVDFCQQIRLCGLLVNTTSPEHFC